MNWLHLRQIFPSYRDNSCIAGRHVAKRDAQTDAFPVAAMGYLFGSITKLLVALDVGCEKGGMEGLLEADELLGYEN